MANEPSSDAPPVSVPAKPSAPFIDESIDDVGASTSHYFSRHKAHFLIPLGITVLLEIIFVWNGASAAIVYVFPLVIPFVAYGIVRSKVQHEFMQQFAAANGFSYAATGSLAGLDGSLFRIGHDRAATDVVSGKFEGHPISLFTYTYVIGSGKSQETYNDTVYELEFPAALPDMLLENNRHTFGASLVGTFSGKELVKLEGDFNKYFSLNIAKGFEVEALEIFTPDVMEELVAKAKGLSLEIVNGHIFIYCGAIVGTKQGLNELYALAQYFIEKLGPVLARMNPALLAPASPQPDGS